MLEEVDKCFDSSDEEITGIQLYGQDNGIYSSFRVWK